MIDKENYSEEHIKALKQLSGANEDIIERTLFAFGLLEAISQTGLEFIFKGGSCLLVLLKEPHRFSTDIDIVVKPGTDIDSDIEKAGRIFPFFHVSEHFRQKKNNIEKRHFKFLYLSPLKNREVKVLLDVLFEENNYISTIQKTITNDLIISDGKDVSVVMPGINCILGDKLTAFAPHTTGIGINEQKELEIIKQMFDCASLLREMTDFKEVKETYHRIVKSELSYRELTIPVEDVLMDTIRSGAVIAGRGSLYKSDDFSVYAKGVRSIGTHLLKGKYDMTRASADAVQVMYLASSVLKDFSDFKLITDYSTFLKEKITIQEFTGLSPLKKISQSDYAYLIGTFKNLEEGTL